MDTRNQHRSMIVVRILLPTILCVTAIGCYTVLNHPQIAPPERVTSTGTVIDEANCGGCHTSSDLWSFHHSGLNQQIDRMTGEPHGLEDDWTYYYNPYDRYFAREGWYNGGYYQSWSSYHHRSWWSLGYASRAMAKAVISSDDEEYVGRGARRDGADRQRSRGSTFVDLLPPPATTFMPMYGGLSVSTSLPPTAARTAADSAEAEESRGRTPSRVRSRYPSSQPVTHSAVAPAPATSESSKKAKDDDDDEEKKASKAKSTGRGARRR
jgi:hypothetical protein